jgi:hypothetical protein
MALTSLLGVLGLLLTAGILWVSYLAFRRTGADRLADKRQQLRQNAGELGLLIDDALEKLAHTRQSHRAVLAMIGLGLSGNAQIFEQGANADDAELKQLRDRTQAEFGEIDPKATDTELETKLVNAHGIRTRVEQIRAKYAAVLADDDVRRAERRREVADKVNRSHPT